MVKVEINPGRIERVVIEAVSEMERDFDTATFIAIQPMLRQINRELQQLIRTALPQDNEP
jgi:hypothetical protein